MKNKEISTSVDKLVNLVNDHEKISFKQAAKKLAIPVSTVEEWAKVLDEEDILDIDYKLSNPVMIKKKLSKEQKKKELDEFKKSRQVFEKKIESATSYFDELDKKISYVTKIFKDMEGVMSSKLGSIDKELDELRKAEQEKEKLDEQIIDAKKRSLKKIQDIESHLEKEKVDYTKTYSNVNKELEKDEEELKKNKTFLDKIKEEEKSLKKKLDDVHSLSKQIQDEIDTREKKIENAENHMLMVQKKHEFLKKELQEEHNSLKDMIEENESQEKIIRNLQKSVFEKMQESEKKITDKEKEVKDLPNHFKSIIEHKNQIGDLINIISHEEIELKEEVKKLRQKAKDLEKSLGTPSFEKEMKELNKRIDEVTSKRLFFKDKIKKLIRIFDDS